MLENPLGLEPGGSFFVPSCGLRSTAQLNLRTLDSLTRRDREPRAPPPLLARAVLVWMDLIMKTEKKRCF